ncbi:BTB/POZ domain and ankyrin repeat-containing protein NPR1-like [Cornus florida]|uniref:BTB/POZ domain and ankyrin repeat-containing protein NPR1-like n=1 Tax=Cornus florida TaxID=4283 RepID=UPI00289C6BF1|nr:BTB/POZ domain and ankyrin repeat-containing protein NPR1-like [Cornus florida]
MDSRTALSDSMDFSGSSSICCAANTSETISPEISAPEIAALNRLSVNLESIFESSQDLDFFADAKIGVSDGREVAVHRCVLSARSPFFKNVFACKERGVNLELKELAKEFDVSFDALVSVLAYLYSGKVKPLPEGVCVCVDEECRHVACRPAVDFMVEVLYASFVFEISELVSLYERHLLDILNNIAADDILVVLSVANTCSKVCERLLVRCIENIVRSDIDVVTMDKALPQHIVKQIVDSRMQIGLHEPESNSFPDKHVKRIHRALDSDDVKLVEMLLEEGHTTLDDAHALHYAVAYCDAKTTTELLDLSLADVNRRNPRGYTVLHVAALRKEPNILVSLLTKGAQPSDLTTDGRKALHISKRLTRAVDYFKSIGEGEDSPKERLCIEVLEQAERDPLLGEAAFSLAVAGEDLRMKLLYLENRVGLAKMLFPVEAKVAMDIAQVDGTSEFTIAGINSKNLAGNGVDLNESFFKIKEEHLNRLRALSKTVQLGKRYFPRCSEVLNKIMDADDITELACVHNDTPEQRRLKRQRFMELQDVLSKAFTQDKEEYDRSNNISSSSSSTSIGGVKRNDRFAFKK